MDKKALPVRQEGRLVTLPLKPGAQTIYLRWHQSSVFSRLYHTPEVDVGTDAVNARLTLKMPDSRWTLATFGPRWGTGRIVLELPDRIGPHGHCTEPASGSPS